MMTQVTQKFKSKVNEVNYRALIAYHDSGNRAEAIKLANWILNRDLNDPLANGILGEIAFRDKKYDKCIEFFERYLLHGPELDEATLLLGISYLNKNDYPKAKQYLTRTLLNNPDSYDAHCNIGILYHSLLLKEKAIHHLNRAIEIAPDRPEAYNNLGLVYYDYAEFDKGLDVFKKALTVQPYNSELKKNASITLLAAGQWDPEGWREYELRLLYDKNVYYPPGKPQWGGETGSRVLLVHEQGIGDAIFCVRWFEQLRAQFKLKKLCYFVPESLSYLMQSIKGVDWVGHRKDRVPEIDAYLPVFSIPRVLKLTPADVIEKGEPTQFLTPPGDVDTMWMVRLGSNQNLRVGLCWRGNRNHPGDWKRSLPIKRFKKLGQTKGCSFYSLQKDAPELETRLSRFTLMNFSDDLRDFADTAGLINALDLVITVDTSVAHLASSLGKETWMLLPYSQDWRWEFGYNSENGSTAWYPTMRIFKQSNLGEWNDVFDKVEKELRLKVASRNEAKAH